jgi:MAD (mothers against decapentaplegic) family protein 4
VFRANNPGVLQDNPVFRANNPGVAEKNPVFRAKNPGVAEKNPGVIQKNPGVIQKNPGVAEKNPGVFGADPGVFGADPGVFGADSVFGCVAPVWDAGFPGAAVGAARVGAPLGLPPVGAPGQLLGASVAGPAEGSSGARAVVPVANRPNQALHRTRPCGLFLLASWASVCVTGVAAGPVSLVVRRQRRTSEQSPVSERLPIRRCSNGPHPAVTR